MTAQQVSRILREAGVPKASPYRIWGRDQDGFVVFAPSKFVPDQPVTIVVTASHSAGRALCAQVTDALDAAGITYVLPRSNGVGGNYRIEVSTS